MKKKIIKFLNKSIGSLVLLGMAALPYVLGKLGGLNLYVISLVEILYLLVLMTACLVAVTFNSLMSLAKVIEPLLGLINKQEAAFISSDIKDYIFIANKDLTVAELVILKAAEAGDIEATIAFLKGRAVRNINYHLLTREQIYGLVKLVILSINDHTYGKLQPKEDSQEQDTVWDLPEDEDKFLN